MNHGPPTKRRKLTDSDSVPVHSENRLIGTSKKRKDADGDILMAGVSATTKSNTNNPTDTEEKQNAPDHSPRITPPVAAPPHHQHHHQQPLLQPSTGDPSMMFSHGGGGGPAPGSGGSGGGVEDVGGEGFMLFSQQDSGNLKTEMVDVMSNFAGDNGLDASQIKTAGVDTDTLFEKTKMQCELVWKLHGTLHSRYKKDMAAKDESWQRRVEDIAANHQEEMTVQRKEYDQMLRDLSSEHKRNLQEQKEETEKRLQIVSAKNDELQTRIDDRDATITKLREEKSMLEKNYGELSSQYEALKTRFEGARALFLGPAEVGNGLPSTPASSDGNPSKGPKAKKRRLSEI